MTRNRDWPFLQPSGKILHALQHITKQTASCLKGRKNLTRPKNAKLVTLNCTDELKYKHYISIFKCFTYLCYILYILSFANMTKLSHVE